MPSKDYYVILGVSPDETEAPLTLRIPPMMRDGDLFQVPVTGLGIDDAVLRILIRVRD